MPRGPRHLFYAPVEVRRTNPAVEHPAGTGCIKGAGRVVHSGGWSGETAGIMIQLLRRWVLAAGAACLTLACTTSAAAAETTPASPADLQFFQTQVRPLLEAHCLKCHGAEEKVKGGFRLTSRQSILQGGDLGPAVQADKPADSLLIKAIHYSDEKLRMPPKGKLPPEAAA